MRVLRSVLFVLVAAGSLAAPAFGESADVKPARKAKSALPPYRLIRIIPETHQALLYDRNRDTYVLVDAGNSVGGFEVTDIASDHVVLSRPGDSREFVLVAGETEAPTTRLADPYPIPANPTGEPAPVATSPLLDPYPADVLDPYGSEGYREVVAPSGQRASEEPPPSPKVETPARVEPPASPPSVETPVTEPAPKELSFNVTRTALDAALSDFAQIGRELEMSVVAGGVRINRVAKDSFFDRMGLRDGDLVRSVDGTAIKGLDDAAVVYARLGKVKRFAVVVERAGTPLTLRFQIAAK